MHEGTVVSLLEKCSCLLMDLFFPQPALFTRSKSTIKRLEQDMKLVQS